MSTEREVKFAVPEGFALPDFGGLGEGMRAADQGTHLLEAVYWDTDELTLFHARWGLRHRTRDGRDGTWTLKGPSSLDDSALVREEIEVRGSPDSIPDSLQRRLLPVLRGEPAHPIARIHTRRHAVDIDASGERRLEVADDDVRVLDAAGSVVTRFREVEVEVVGAGAGTVLDAVLGQLRGLGATVHRGSKYERALAALGLTAAPSE